MQIHIKFWISLVFLQASIFFIEAHTIESFESKGLYRKALEQARLEPSNQDEIKRLESNVLLKGSSLVLFDEELKPREDLLAILKLAGMECSEERALSLEEVNAWAQAHLLRQGERWEEQQKCFEPLKSQLLPLLKELGFVGKASPLFHNYQGALVHGALLTAVRFRLHFLVEAWKNGSRFKEIYFLSGARPLDPAKESQEAMLSDTASSLKIRKEWSPPSEWPQTECEMMQLVWEQADLPEEMRKETTAYFVNASMKLDPKTGHFLRPTTNDAVAEWQTFAPHKGRYIVVSNSPYTHRQDLVTRTNAPFDFCFDTIGPCANENNSMAIYLDELARLIYQTKLYFHLKP